MIGERLAEVRKDHGHTQEDLAQLLRVAKVTISSWEQEKSSPDHVTLVSICKLYKVSSDFLLGLTSEDPLYTKRRRDASLSAEDKATLKDFEEFLMWRQKNTPRHL